MATKTKPSITQRQARQETIAAASAAEMKAQDRNCDVLEIAADLIRFGRQMRRNIIVKRDASFIRGR